MTIRTTWHHLDRTQAAEAAIAKHYEKLLTFSREITSAHIFIGQANSSPSASKSGVPCFNLVLEIHVPGDLIVVSHTPRDLQIRQDLYLSLHHTFDAGRRQLQDYVRKRQGKVKHHQHTRNNAPVELEPPEPKDLTKGETSNEQT